MRYFDIQNEAYGLTIAKGGITKAYTIWNDCSKSISANFAHDEDELPCLCDWANDIEKEAVAIKDDAAELERQAHYLLKKAEEMRGREKMLRGFHGAISDVAYVLDPTTPKHVLDRIIAKEVDSE